MGSQRLHHRIVDTNGLAAIGHSAHSETVFTSVGMTTTANCFKELRAGMDDPYRHFAYRNGAKVAYEYFDDREEYDNLALFAAPGSPVYSANNAGELSIRVTLFERPETFEIVVTYDDDVGPILRPVKDAGIDVSILPPNEPLFALYRQERLSRQDYCETTADIIYEQGWKRSMNADTFWRFPVDCTLYR